MKVKIFSVTTITGLEDRINKFIKGKKVIDIKQSECITDECWSITITVLYDEDD
ncbi:hypothetical protein [Anaeromicrobium sediminis]|uniref:hypothetical protein n=1 Tax=Anaeromicrobium sediminis TaxID=1478221 RepID=UPI00159595FE|nr:hypothetical protein [Anaeromicrobium sediminis]